MIRGKAFLENNQLRDGRFLLQKRGENFPLGSDNRSIPGYRYSFKGPVKQCRLCANHRPQNVRLNSREEHCYCGAFNCAVKDFQSSSGYVVVLNCDRWELAENAPRKNRGKAWLYFGEIVCKETAEDSKE